MKRIFGCLIIFICCFSCNPTAFATGIGLTSYTIFSQNRVYDHCFDLEDSFNTVSWAILSSDGCVTPSATVKFDGQEYPLSPLPRWNSYFREDGQLFYERYFEAPPPGSSWEEKDYTFSATCNAAVNLSVSAHLSTKFGFFKKIACPSSININKGNYLDIRWDEVPGACSYNIKLFALDDSGNPETSNLLFNSGDLLTNNYLMRSFANMNIGDYALCVESRDYLNNGTLLINRSQFFTKISKENDNNSFANITAGFLTDKTTGEAPFAVRFTGSSQDSVISWAWDFGDGTVSGEPNPIHIYRKLGTYDVKLTVSTANGSDTVIKNNLVSISDNSYTRGLYNYYLPYFSSINNNWTGLGVSNNSQEATSLQVSIYSRDGDCLDKSIINIPINGQKSLPLWGDSNTEGWILINSHSPLSGLAFLGVAAPTQLLANIPFIRDLSRSLVIPHVAQDIYWDTSIFVCNPQSAPTTVTLKWIDNDGLIKGVRQSTIPANGGEMYPLSIFSSSVAGKIHIFSTDGIAAFALYNNLKTGGTYLAGINADPRQ